VDVSIVIATFGSSSWLQTAQRVALPSALAQNVPVIVRHGESLSSTRNEAAMLATSQWLIFLDADDELAPGYVEAMSQSSGDLRVPRLMLDGVEVDLRRRQIERMNPCPIGTAIERDRFFDVGGFPDFDAWEDWALFLRAHRRGATIDHTDAVYLARHDAAGRNSTVKSPQRLRREIRTWA